MTREEAIAELSVLHERLSNPKDCEDGCYSWEDGLYVEAIDMAIEALQDRPHGEWLKDDYLYKCSVCGNEEIIANNYCPSCGAFMDEVMSVYGGADMSMGVKSLDSDDLVDGNEVKVLGAEGGEEE